MIASNNEPYGAMIIYEAARNALVGNLRAGLSRRLVEASAPQRRFYLIKAAGSFYDFSLYACLPRPRFLHRAGKKIQASPFFSQAFSSSPPTTEPDSASSLSEQMRSAMRLLTSSVVVCTSTHDGMPRAMTMSSFTSLALHPTPLVTFNVLTPSRTLDAIESSREFNIHVLSGDAAGAAVAHHFTRGNAEGAFEGLAGMTASTASSGPPLVSGNGVLCVLRCRALHQAPQGGLVKVRDHVIVVGEVMEMIPGKGMRQFGLAYADRKYRRIGTVIAEGAMRPDDCH